MDNTDAEELRRVRAHLGWPRGKELATGDFGPALADLGRLAVALGAEQLAELAGAAMRDPLSPDRLYDLGYALIDAGLPTIAASVLWRCLDLVGDSEEVVCELVSALETALAYRDAFTILDEHAALRARSFLCSYLYAFDAAMIGRLDVTRAQLPALAADPEAPETEVMRATIEAIIARADRIAGASPLDDRDLRGWHYVLTGGLVTHQSPYGFDEPMRGRYALLEDSYARVATGIARLAALVAASGADVPCVYAPPGRDHEIVARAVAARLGVSLAPWPAVGTPAPGLVVLYDLAQLEQADLARLQHRRAGQILFAHASPWTRDSPIAPDVTTLLYQFLGSPWRDRQGDPAELAAELAAIPGLGDEELVADEPARWEALVVRAWPPEPGTRSRLWAGGPVASSRFD